MNSPPMGSKVEVIQELRGIASIGVLLWHASTFLGPYGTGIGGTLFLSAPTMGVDLFFVICGFVMVVSSIRPDGRVVAPGAFFARRFARIYPLYFIATLSIFMVEPSVPIQTIGRLLRSLVLMPHADGEAPGITAPTLNVGWTIIYEVEFYLIFGLSLLLGKNYWKGLAGWFAVAMILPALLASTSIVNPYSAIVGLPANFQILFNPLNWLFACGIVIALVYRSPFRIENPFAVRVLSLAAIALAITQYAMQFRVVHGVFGAGLSMVPLVFILTLGSKTVNLSPNRVLSHLGRISFSLYLLHPSAIWMYVRGRDALGMDNPWEGWFAVLFVTSLSILMANLSFRFVESGLSEFLRYRLTNCARALLQAKESAKISVQLESK